MAIQRAVFTVTCDTNGRGTADVRLKLPSTLTRHATILRVSVDVGNVGGGVPEGAAVSSAFTVTLNELYDPSVIPGYTGTETVGIGDQLFHLDSKDRNGFEFAPSSSGVDLFGRPVSASNLVVNKVIKTANTRCLVVGAGSGDVVVVNLYYQTAGDFRF